MKKFITLLLLTFLSISCSSDDSSSNSSSSSKTKITPPSWIIGSWLQGSEGGPKVGYKLSNNDICMLGIGGAETCMKAAVEVNKDTPQIVTKVEQTISDSEYECIITIGSQVINYHFQKVSANSIKDVNMSNTIGYEVILKKQ